MLHASDFKKIHRIVFLILMILVILSFGLCIVDLSQADNDSAYISWASILLLIIIIYTPLYQLIVNTYIKAVETVLSTEVSKNDSNILSIGEIKRLGSACTTLDKYGIKYTINYTNRVVDAYVTMGMYTRMSVADNLEYGVNYHIQGTETILVKPQK